MGLSSTITTVWRGRYRNASPAEIFQKFSGNDAMLHTSMDKVISRSNRPSRTAGHTARPHCQRCGLWGGSYRGAPLPQDEFYAMFSKLGINLPVTRREKVPGVPPSCTCMDALPLFFFACCVRLLLCVLLFRDTPHRP